MTYRENQRQKATTMRDAFFRDPGGGLYANLKREFVLKDATLNLWAGIRNERSQTRGANATAVDAAMIGRKPSGSNVLVLIEWKYTEAYGEQDKYIPARYEIYDPLLADEQSPISVEDFNALYYEPFYQLMRQTLLGWKMVQHREYNCDEWIHLHVIPEGNVELRERVTSPALRSEAAKRRSHQIPLSF